MMRHYRVLGNILIVDETLEGVTEHVDRWQDIGESYMACMVMDDETLQGLT